MLTLPVRKITDMSSKPAYEGTLHKRFMNFLTLQPLVVDEALMPYLKAMHVISVLIKQNHENSRQRQIEGEILKICFILYKFTFC